jgi:hypothetical protein
VCHYKTLLRETVVVLNIHTITAAEENLAGGPFLLEEQTLKT